MRRKRSTAWTTAAPWRFPRKSSARLPVRRRQLKELEAKGGDPVRINELKQCINQDEDLLQAVKFELHGISGI